MTDSESSSATALHYHELTKHSYWSIRSNSHYLDWANKPLSFKTYTTIDPIPLAREVRQSGIATLSAIADQIRPNDSRRVDLQLLISLLYFSYGITKTKKYPGGEIHFRAAACTGALYEFELYLVTENLSDLSAGVYHFSPAEFCLRQLRSGDFRGVIAEATDNRQSVIQAHVAFICAGTYWRNAWKYQARTYRHFGWDNGMIAANMLALATAHGISTEVISAFTDSQVNQLIGLDEEKEVSFSIITLGATSKKEIPSAPPMLPLALETLPLSPNEVRYALMNDVHRASSFTSAGQVRGWQSQLTPEPKASSAVVRSVELTQAELSHLEPLEKTILKRGSTRNFAREPISFEQLSTILDLDTRGFRADFHQPTGALLSEIYLIVHAVNGMEPGAYYFNRNSRSLELIKAGDFRNEAAYLGLEQQLAGDASVDIFYMADLPLIIDRYGDRGYRAAQLEAGILGGKVYLAAYAQGLGATGLTFFDDSVTEFFSPHAEGKSPIFLMCLGRSAKRSSA